MPAVEHELDASAVSAACAHVETALTLRLVFHLPLRQVEGFLKSLLAIMDIDLASPDHTTLSRRGRDLDVNLRPVPTNEPMHLIVDSTGLSIVGEGEWAAARHGGNEARLEEGEEAPHRRRRARHHRERAHAGALAVAKTCSRLTL